VSASLTPAWAHLSVPPRSTTHSLIEMLVRHREELLDEWRRGLGPDAASLRRTDVRTEPMTHVIDALLADLERESREPMIAPESVFAAAVHGTSRRMQAIGLELVLREFDVLRHSTNLVLRRLCPSPPPRELVGRLDFVITTASLASLRGYHRDEFDALGQWPSTLDDLLRAEDPWAEVKERTAAAS
jgi:hypothetical protein